MSITKDTEEKIEVQRRRELAASPLARLQRMIEIRFVEDRIQDLFAQGLIPGTTHTSQGQEAVAVALGTATRPTDIVLLHHTEVTALPWRSVSSPRPYSAKSWVDRSGAWEA